ncbi:hypothetical protein PRIPAC_95324 [Pristionchus pacificus]|uniref:Uncharacterized protein n=1 Tax=Pristionchus pacificus TaxID=54126 RepID=A0A454Y3G3_PRIPA|nr:hypothetical protein PRIPAC_95324 [Pristionchus pacificus]|eukprot:PDM81923.1 hypothetical protein PRIPAC_34077 [Pristionchus pacificus]
MAYSIFLLLTTVMAALASEVVSLDEHSSALCASRPIDGSAFKRLRSNVFCLQTLVVPEGQVAQIFFSNRQAYCGRLGVEEKSLAQVTGPDSTITHFCSAPAPSLTLPSGSHYIGVSPSSVPLKVSLTYINTLLGCGDKVSNALLGIPLTFVPTRSAKCTLLLPGRSVLTIKAVRRTPGSQHVGQCVRLRMGKAIWNVNRHFPPICKVTEPLSFNMGCGIVVMDASNEAVEKVDFTVRKMDEEQSILAPLMCDNYSETDDDSDY